MRQRECPTVFYALHFGSYEQKCPIWGYKEMLEVLKDPSDPQYNDWAEWLPDDFDPDRFSKERVNDELKKFAVWCDGHPTEKSTPWHQLR